MRYRVFILIAVLLFLAMLGLGYAVPRDVWQALDDTRGAWPFLIAGALLVIWLVIMLIPRKPRD